MTLHLYDSQAKALVEFTPRTPGKVGMYLCGATVQAPPHIGHLRSAIAFDVLVRWLRRSDHEVTLVRNVTDIDDKVLTKSAAAGRPWWAWAYLHERIFTEAYTAVNISPVTYEPRATGHVPEMIALMELLVERGHAYTGDPGNVYFAVRSLDDYGSLTRQSVDHLSADPSQTEDAASDKRDPLDFALWKAAKPGEPEDAAWDTPFGRGRPGWHLECSAMAHRYLGEEFDIHAGGLDLRFPHHENEQAQSHAAGWGFTRYWLHNAWVTVSGEKMSKSLGNSLMVSQILDQAPPAVVRYALGTVHYRSTIEYDPVETLKEAAASWNRITGFLERALPGEDLARSDVSQHPLPTPFVTAMNDDVNVSAALAVIHDHLRSGNTRLAAGQDATDAALTVRAMLGVLGLDPADPAWNAGRSSEASRLEAALDELIHHLLDQRSRARAEKDFATADKIRDQLAAAGIELADGHEQTRWSLKES